MLSEILNFFKLLFVIAVVVALIYLLFYFKSVKERTQKSLLEFCLSVAQQIYTIDWNNACRRLGEKKNCDLPSFFTDPIEKRYQKEREDCLKRYPSK